MKKNSNRVLYDTVTFLTGLFNKVRGIIILSIVLMQLFTGGIVSAIFPVVLLFAGVYWIAENSDYLRNFNWNSSIKVTKNSEITVSQIATVICGALLILVILDKIASLRFISILIFVLLAVAIIIGLIWLGPEMLSDLKKKITKKK